MGLHHIPLRQGRHFTKCGVQPDQQTVPATFELLDVDARAEMNA